MFRNSIMAFIGSGTMAEAMIKGLTDQARIAPQQIIASGPRPERGEYLHSRYGIQATTNNVEAVRDADIVVLSIKPQVLPKVLKELHDKPREDALILSIVAGAKIRVISQGLGRDAVVRAMPNTPARVGMGMTVWTATPHATELQIAQARQILSALGDEIYMEDEEYLDMATALSGTGPAYVFFFMEALIDAGVHLGFSRRIAQQLVLKTIEGSVEIAKQTGLHPVELRNSVTSPGGTTAEALYQLEKGGMRTVLSKAIWAAYQKSRYLGELIEKQNGDLSD
ncbi:MAG: pyrroline-5-carboxylate reductase [Anaerolineae bacterium]